MNRSQRITRPFLLLATALLAASAAWTPTSAQTSAEELVLTSRLAVDLANQALEDVVLPLGGLLGRISPGSGYASGAHGIGWAAVSVGAVGLQFEMTSPDYEFFKRNGIADVIEGPAAAVYADFEVGLYRGVPVGTARNVGSIDLLLRWGLTLGDQDDLGDDIDVSKVIDTLEPIYGAGARIGLLRGPGLPAVSMSFGFNHFVERSFRYLGEVDDQPFAVGLGIEQTSSFLMFEVAKDLGFFTPYVGAGRVKHAMNSSYAAEIRISGSDENTTIGEDVDVKLTHTNLFGGLELFPGSPVRLVIEAGALDDTAYGSFALRIVPFGRDAD